MVPLVDEQPKPLLSNCVPIATVPPFLLRQAAGVLLRLRMRQNAHRVVPVQPAEDLRHVVPTPHMPPRALRLEDGQVLCLQVPALAAPLMRCHDRAMGWLSILDSPSPPWLSLSSSSRAAAPAKVRADHTAAI